MVFSNGAIKFTRGDDDALLVVLGGGAAFKTGDVVYFSVKEDKTSTEDVFQLETNTFVPYTDPKTNVTVENAAAFISISHNQTIELDLKDYFYDIFIKWEDGMYVTVVHPTKFTLVPGGSHANSDG